MPFALPGQPMPNHPGRKRRKLRGAWGYTVFQGNGTPIGLIPWVGASSATLQSDDIIVRKDMGVTILTADGVEAAPHTTSIATTFVNAASPTKITGNGGDSVYNSWTIDNGFYDAVRDQIVQIYMSAPAHSPTPDIAANYVRKARARIMTGASTYNPATPGSPFGAPVDVYSASQRDCYVYAATCLSNGDYVALGLQTQFPAETGGIALHLIRSTNGGASWTDEGVLNDNMGTPILIESTNGEYAYALTQLSDGSVGFWHLNLAVYGVTGDWTWYRAPAGAVNGTFERQFTMDQNWRSVLLENDTNVPLDGPSSSFKHWNPFEPSVVELGNGLLLSLWRPTGAGETTGAKVLYSLGFDFGRTWSPWQPTNITGAANNAAPVYHADKGVVEMFLGVRGVGNNVGGVVTALYQASATLADVLVGKFNPSVKVRNGLVNNATYDQDFGGVNLIRAGPNVFGFYYDWAAASSSNNTAEIYMLKGSI